ncbi:hypothetical protein NGK36_10775 [Hafnia alvei]|uniref:hypothetical protein n=1 Tax=Hafnia alvei TaxID=569 RepID=UPI002DBC7111|nr:hypothetical protein [Hafnia alvei]MEB7889779.1 hypothetical protein [Hafnia alvei]
MEIESSKIHVLDMINIHQGWKAGCGIVMVSEEHTQSRCDELTTAGLLVKTDDGWFKVSENGSQYLKEYYKNVA